MKTDIIEIMKAPYSSYRYPGFFRGFAVKDLKKALDYLEEEGKSKTENRRRSIWYEIQRREKLARMQGVPVEDIVDVIDKQEIFGHAPARTSRFAAEWNETCLAIYRKIQFLPDILIVAR